MFVSYKSNLKTKYDDLVKLVDVPVVVYVNKFDADTAKKFSEEFNKAAASPQPIIPIVIDSPGGMVDSLMYMLDVCRSSRKPIATVTLGKAASCGAVLATAGWHGYRFAGPLARFMIHDVSTICMGKTEELLVDAHEANRLNESIYRIMAENCQKPPRYFWDIVHSKGRADWYLTATEAMEHNIVNHVKVPEISIDLTVSYAFA